MKTDLALTRDLSWWNGCLQTARIYSIVPISPLLVQYLFDILHSLQALPLAFSYYNWRLFWKIKEIFRKLKKKIYILPPRPNQKHELPGYSKNLLALLTGYAIRLQLAKKKKLRDLYRTLKQIRNCYTRPEFMCFCGVIIVVRWYK